MESVASETGAAHTAEQKALSINLANQVYGTFAEIGAGQEVARQFFRVGGAAGTVAKTISAYDMKISDELYGKSGRYVSRERLAGMLQREYSLLLERLSAERGAESTFFVFADTVAARNYQGTNECHGWLGVRFQDKPLAPPSEIVIHVRMNDKTNALQQQALGTIGVNLLYSVFYLRGDSDRFIAGLIEELSLERIEVDMIEVSGPAFTNVENRLMSLKLIQHGLTNAIMLAADRTVLQPSEELRKRPVLVSRGSFRPITNVNLDMVTCALGQFKTRPEVIGKDPVVLFEISLNNLMAEGELNDADFLARADTISALGYPVLITNLPQFHQIAAYLSRYTRESIAMVLGLDTLVRVFDEKYYGLLDGGVLEAVARLFKKNVKLYVYPVRRELYNAAVEQRKSDGPTIEQQNIPGIVTLDDLKVNTELRHLYSYLRETKSLEPVSGFKKELLSNASRDVLEKIRCGDKEWEDEVPASAAALIKERNAFGFHGAV